MDFSPMLPVLLFSSLYPFYKLLLFSSSISAFWPLPPHFFPFCIFFLLDLFLLLFFRSTVNPWPPPSFTSKKLIGVRAVGRYAGGFFLFSIVRVSPLGRFTFPFLFLFFFAVFLFSVLLNPFFPPRWTAGVGIPLFQPRPSPS